MTRTNLMDLLITICSLFLYAITLVGSLYFKEAIGIEFNSDYFVIVGLTFSALIPLIFLKRALSKNFLLPISKMKWSLTTLVVGCIFGFLIVLVSALPQLISTKIQCCSYYSGVTGYAINVAKIFTEAFEEEVLYRVLCLALFVAIFRSFFIAILLQTIVFGLAHSGFHWSSLDSVLYYLLPALILGLVFWLKNDLSLISGIHFGLNYGVSVFFSAGSLLNFDGHLEQDKTLMIYVLGASLICLGFYSYFSRFKFILDTWRFNQKIKVLE